MNYVFKNHQDPGLAVDAVKILAMKLNPEHIWLQSLLFPSSYLQDEAYVKQQLSLFSDPDSKLYLFVYISKTNPVCFLTKYLKNQIEKSFDSFAFQDFISSFDEVTKIKKALLSHYTGVVDYTTIDIETLIRHDDSMPDKIKVLLYGFLIKPDKYLESLKKYLYLFYNVLIKTNRTLTKTTLDSSTIKTLLSTCIKDPDKFLSGITDSTIRYSICSTIPNYLEFGTNSYFWMILTENIIVNLTQSPNSVPSDYLIYLGDALRNHARLTIIRELTKKHQLNFSELVHHTNLATSTIQHHLIILKKARLITEYKHGKQTVYSLNPDGLLYASKTLSDMAKEWNQNEKMA